MKAPQGISPVCCWPVPCNGSCRVVMPMMMMMMMRGLLGARLKAHPLALSSTSPMGLDMKRLPSLRFTISCLFVSWRGQWATCLFLWWRDCPFDSLTAIFLIISQSHCINHLLKSYHDIQAQSSTKALGETEHLQEIYCKNELLPVSLIVL